jgi:hypothetical protein
MRVMAISPAIIGNDQDNALTINGVGFTEDLTLDVGSMPLTNVVLRNSTEFSATLPSGLCPGTYALTIKDASGASVAGHGRLVVKGIRQATLGAWAASPAISFAGRAQAITVELPVVEIVDTTCSTDDWQITLSLGTFSPFEDGRGALPLRGLRLDGVAGSRSDSPTLTVKEGVTSGTLSVPRTAEQSTASIRPLIRVDVPSHGYAGQYRMSVAVSITGGTPDQGTRPPGGKR